MRGTDGTQSFAISPARISSTWWLRSLATLVALAVAMFIWVEDADALLKGGSALGSRSSGSSMLPPVTAGASDRMAVPDRWQMAQDGQPAHPGGSLGKLFKRPGLVGGFSAGFLGAGFLGVLFGHGMFGGLGGVASVLGLLFQLVLVVMLVRLIWTWWHGDNTPAYAGLSPRQLADAYDSRNELLADAGSLAIADIPITESDFNSFDRLFDEIVTAYGREDLDALRTRVTPQLLADLSEHPAHDAGRDIKIMSGLKLHKSDGAEAWREDDTDYAIIPARCPFADHTADGASQPGQVWTFTRAPGHSWLLSGIRQR